MELTCTNTLNIQNILEDFFNYLDVSELTIDTYKEGIKSFIRFLGTNDAPTRQDILKYKEYLLENYKATTVNARLTAIKQLFKWLSFRGIYPNIAENIKQVDIGNIDKNYPTLEEIKYIMSTIKTDYDRALFGLLTTGIRLKEASNANIEDIGILRGQTVLYVLGKGRKSKEEYVKVSDSLLGLLNPVIGERKSGAIFLSTSNNNKGNRASIRALYNRIKKIYENAGIDKDTFTCHALRGSFSVIAMENGASIYEISKVLRHKNIHTTEVYLRSLDRTKNKTEYLVSDMVLEV